MSAHRRTVFHGPFRSTAADPSADVRGDGQQPFQMWPLLARELRMCMKMFIQIFIRSQVKGAGSQDV